jgi:hypothetical protein
VPPISPRPAYPRPRRENPLLKSSQVAQNVLMDRRKIEACLPPKLHGFSRMILDYYLDGQMTTAEFRRWFHMPNSEYLMLGDCIAQIMDPSYIPEDKLPESVTLNFRH